MSSFVHDISHLLVCIYEVHMYWAQDQCRSEISDNEVLMAFSKDLVFDC